MSDVAAVIVEYTNYRGETSRRTIKPLRLWWGNTEFHPENQWMLTAYDCEKKVERDFAWQDMIPVRNPATSAASSPAVAALAMRERAAKACDGFCSECARAIRALPTTFTDAELLAAAMQLPEVRALIEAATPFSQAVIRNGVPAAGAIERTDITNIRAAIAPFKKGGE